MEADVKNDFAFLAVDKKKKTTNNQTKRTLDLERGTFFLSYFLLVSFFQYLSVFFSRVTRRDFELTAARSS